MQGSQSSVDLREIYTDLHPAEAALLAEKPGAMPLVFVAPGVPVLS